LVFQNFLAAYASGFLGNAYTAQQGKHRSDLKVSSRPASGTMKWTFSVASFALAEIFCRGANGRKRVTWKSWFGLSMFALDTGLNTRMYCVPTSVSVRNNPATDTFFFCQKKANTEQKTWECIKEKLHLSLLYQTTGSGFLTSEAAVSTLLEIASCKDRR